MKGLILLKPCAIKACVVLRDLHYSRTMMVFSQREIGLPSQLYIHPVRRQMRREFFLALIDPSS